MNNDTIQSLEKIVSEVNLVERISNKTQRTYKLIQIKLTNGYELELFTRERAEMTLLELLLKSATK